MGDIVSGLHAGAKHGVWRLMQTFLSSPSTEKAKDRRAREKEEARSKKFGEAGEPASEAYVKWKKKEKERAAEKEGKDGKDEARKSHDKKRADEPDRSKERIDEDYR